MFIAPRSRKYRSRNRLLENNTAFWPTAMLLLRKGTIEKKTFQGFKHISIHLGHVCDRKRAGTLAGREMIKGNVKPAFKARGFYAGADPISMA